MDASPALPVSVACIATGDAVDLLYTSRERGRPAHASPLYHPWTSPHSPRPSNVASSPFALLSSLQVHVRALLPPTCCLPCASFQVRVRSPGLCTFSRSTCQRVPLCQPSASRRKSIVGTADYAAAAAPSWRRGRACDSQAVRALLLPRRYRRAPRVPTSHHGQTLPRRTLPWTSRTRIRIRRIHGRPTILARHPPSLCSQRKEGSMAEGGCCSSTCMASWATRPVSRASPPTSTTSSPSLWHRHTPCIRRYIRDTGRAERSSSLETISADGTVEHDRCSGMPPTS